MLSLVGTRKTTQFEIVHDLVALAEHPWYLHKLYLSTVPVAENWCLI